MSLIFFIISMVFAPLVVTPWKVEVATGPLSIDRGGRGRKDYRSIPKTRMKPRNKSYLLILAWALYSSR